MERTISKIGAFREMFRGNKCLTSWRQNVRLAMRSEKGRPKPFFWAALVLKGEWMGNA